MRGRVIKIGNPQGLRIPKPILNQTGILDGVEIAVEKIRLSFDRLVMFVMAGRPLLKRCTKMVMRN